MARAIQSWPINPMVLGLVLATGSGLPHLPGDPGWLSVNGAMGQAQAAEVTRADAVQRVTWEDLTPPFDHSKDPFNLLDEKQQDALHQLIWLRDIERDGNMGESLSAGAIAVRQSLKASGLDPDGLLAEVDEFDRHIAVWNESLVDDLNGRDIQIAGYALPLEFSDTAITEFLLVPYFGACIHVPPPPTNQIVHVRVAEGFESEGIFMPVSVTGRISTRPQSLSLSFVDGSSDITVGYGLEAAKIEPYKN